MNQCPSFFFLSALLGRLDHNRKITEILTVHDLGRYSRVLQMFPFYFLKTIHSVLMNEVTDSQQTIEDIKNPGVTSITKVGLTCVDRPVGIQSRIIIPDDAMTRGKLVLHGN